MLNEFYRYIARLVIGFFDGHKDILRSGDRYCLRLDNEEMVQHVHDALCEITQSDQIQGGFEYCDSQTGQVIYQTITSATGDLSAQGMPFHAESLNTVIQSHIKGNTLNGEGKALLDFVLKNLEQNQFNDHTSLFEYKGQMTIISRGHAVREDYTDFQLLYDENLKNAPPARQRDRLADNQKRFEQGRICGAGHQYGRQEGYSGYLDRAA